MDNRHHCSPSPQNLRYKEGILLWDEGDKESSFPHNYSESSYIYYNIYGSNTYPVDITLAENLLATRITSTSFELSGRSTSMRYFAVTSSTGLAMRARQLKKKKA